MRALALRALTFLAAAVALAAWGLLVAEVCAFVLMLGFSNRWWAGIQGPTWAELKVWLTAALVLLALCVSAAFLWARLRDAGSR